MLTAHWHTAACNVAWCHLCLYTQNTEKQLHCGRAERGARAVHTHIAPGKAIRSPVAQLVKKGTKKAWGAAGVVREREQEQRRGLTLSFFLLPISPHAADACGSSPAVLVSPEALGKLCRT